MFRFENYSILAGNALLGPTIADALNIASISRYKDPAKLLCCAE